MNASLKRGLSRGRIYIEDVTPQVDGGRYRAKAVVDDRVAVGADVLRDGHDLVRAVIQYRKASAKKWHEAPMTYDAYADRFTGTFVPDALGVWHYAVCAWTDHFGTWVRDLKKRAEANQDLDVELEVGALLIEGRIRHAPKEARSSLKAAVTALRAPKSGDGLDDARVRAATDAALADAMLHAADRSDATTTTPLELTVDPLLARYGAWYEFFPRSTGTKDRHGTFKTAAELLPHVASMGFDVVYLPPIHPIGVAHRKGKNNTLNAGPDDVGSPWAIGSKHGGHTAVHPELGTLKDFAAFVKRAKEHNLHIALDFAIQCSPDHPWVTEHPEWFAHRPDGSIRYAENPPKKYQDIYPIDFATTDRAGLWTALREVLAFWIARGVTVFRVDNPHTKSLAFWEWVIADLKEETPELIFLSEAFTRPRLKRALAKIGFSQSYTYFTWKNGRRDFEGYLNDLLHVSADYLRPNFFPNTPDILHEYLQHGGAPAFRIRLILAALASPSYGMYAGYEFFENKAVRPGSEEYLDSEKYELTPRPLDAPGSLVSLIRRLNVIRDEHPALTQFRNLVFHDADKESVITFSKREGTDRILTIVNTNPHGAEEATVRLDLSALGISPSRPFEVRDLLTDARYLWQGSHNYVRLTPDAPAHVFSVTQA